MNHVFSIVLFAVFLSSCSSDEVTDSPSLDKETSVEEGQPEKKKKDIMYLYKSEDEGVIEYMRSTIKPDGTQFWTYFTEKNKNEVKLGTTEKLGFEAVYFLGKPKELYVIGGSECGFSLTDETRNTSQWYGQYLPSCPDNMY